MNCPMQEVNGVCVCVCWNDPTLTAVATEQVGQGKMFPKATCNQAALRLLVARSLRPTETRQLRGTQCVAWLERGTNPLTRELGTMREPRIRLLVLRRCCALLEMWQVFSNCLVSKVGLLSGIPPKPALNRATCLDQKPKLSLSAPGANRAPGSPAACGSACSCPASSEPGTPRQKCGRGGRLSGKTQNPTSPQLNSSCGRVLFVSCQVGEVDDSAKQ